MEVVEFIKSCFDGELVVMREVRGTEGWLGAQGTEGCSGGSCGEER